MLQVVEDEVGLVGRVDEQRVVDARLRPWHLALEVLVDVFVHDRHRLNKVVNVQAGADENAASLVLQRLLHLEAVLLDAVRNDLVCFILEVDLVDCVQDSRDVLLLLRDQIVHIAILFRLDTRLSHSPPQLGSLSILRDERLPLQEAHRTRGKVYVAF